MKKILYSSGALLTLAMVVAQARQAAIEENAEFTPSNPPFNVAAVKDNKRYIVLFDKQARLHNDDDDLLNADINNENRENLFSAQVATDVIQAHGGKAIRALPSVAGMTARLSNRQLAELRQHPDIRLIEEDPARSLQYDYKDAPEIIPWGIEHIQADQLSDAATGNITLCIADTGYELAHQDLPNGANVTGEVSHNLIDRYATRDLGRWDVDTWGHGTAVAGTIAAIGGNAVGTAGVNPGNNINLHIVKIIDKANWWPYIGSDLIAAVEACQTAGADIINLSLGGQKLSEAEQEAMQRAWDSGTLIVAAAGGRGDSRYFYPASYDPVISVNASDEDNVSWRYAQQNDQIEFVAPGVQARSTRLNSTYGQGDGSSVAAAYVSGALGLVWSHHPECSNKDIRHIMQLTAKDLGSPGRDDLYGFGLIQAKAAVDLLDAAGCDGILNQAPTIDGKPEPSVLQDARYHFVPRIDDEDVDDTLTLSITGKPAWASFNQQTGELSGQPGNDDVGVYDNITITVTDSKGDSAALGPFAITVINVNDPPVFDTAPVTAVAEDQPYHYKLRASDIDPNTQLTFTATQTPNWLQFNPASATLSGTPDNAAVGQHPVTLTVSDGENTVRQTFSVTVSNVNDAPTIDGQSRNSVNENRHYSFTPRAADDDNDTLTFSIDNKPDWAQFNTTTGQLSGSPNGQGSSQHNNIVIKVSDGQETASLAPFSVTVVPSVYTDWANDAAPTQHQAWTPAISTQTSDFSQTRGYKQSQSRQEQQQELHQQTRQVINVGNPFTHKRTVDKTESRQVTVQFMTWQDKDDVFDCKGWTPAPETVDFGQRFNQHNDCRIKQQRTRQYSHDGQPLHNATEARTVDKQQSRPATGEKRNWQPTDSTFTEWTNDGNRHSHTSWTPAPGTQSQNYTQSRDYKQSQTRKEQKREKDAITGDIRLTGDPIRHTRDISGKETADIAVTASSWSDKGAPHHCSTWSKTDDVIDNGHRYREKRTCKQDLERSWTHKRGNNVIHSRKQTKTDERSQSRDQVCSWEATTSTYSNWTNDGNPHSHGTWTPVANAQVNDFKQTRSYKQTQKRHEQKRLRCVETGVIKNEGNTILRKKDISSEEERSVTVTQSVWSNHQDPLNCGAWTQTDDVINNGHSYRQTRQCDQQQKKVWTYKLGNTQLHSRDQFKTVNIKESRELLCDWDPIPSTYTIWTNTGSRHSYSAWTPVAQNQTSNFTQKRSYKQTQQRYEQRHLQCRQTNVEKTNGDRIARKRDVNGEETRSVTVTQSAWSNHQDPLNCGPWTQTDDVINNGHSYRQIRQCDQQQKKVWTYKLGNTRLHSRDQFKTVNIKESRELLCDWDPISSTYTTWTNTGNRHSYSAWTPVAQNQTSNFTQKRSYKQTQQRYEQRHLQCRQTNVEKTNGDRIVRKRDVNGEETRSVTVTQSAWSNHQDPLNCGPWTQTDDVINNGHSYRQIRQCDQQQKKVWTYKLGNTRLHSRDQFKKVNIEESQVLPCDWDPISSTYTTWTNTGSRHSYSAWTPVAQNQTSNFTQKRSYKQTQQRYEQRRLQCRQTNVKKTNGSRITRKRDVNGEESTSIAVAKSSWINVGSKHSCGAWSQTNNKPNGGHSYEEIRQCKQKQKLTWTYKRGPTVVHNRYEFKDISVNDIRTQPCTWKSINSAYSSWSNDGSKSYTSGWGPSCTGKTSDFTQTRPFTQKQKRTEQKRLQCEQTGTIKHSGSLITHTRTITDHTTRVADVSKSGSSYWGSLYSCSAWRNTGRSANNGLAYIRERTCKQDQKQNYQCNVQSGTWTIKLTNRSVDDESIAGCTFEDASTASGWTNSGGGHSYSAWSPAPSNQTINFPQSRTYKQKQTRTVTPKRRCLETGIVTNNGNSRTEAREINKSQTRNVSVTATSWVNNGNVHSCSAWQTKNATTETRSCKQPQKRDRIYKVGSSTIHSVTVHRTINVTQERARATVPDSVSWVNAAGTGRPGSNYYCNEIAAYWSPVTNATHYKIYEDNRHIASTSSTSIVISPRGGDMVHVAVEACNDHGCGGGAGKLVRCTPYL